MIYRSTRYGISSPKCDLPQGTLDVLILKTVALGPVHGYAIAQRLQQISRDVVQVPGGSLYPALHRLETRKLLAAEWRQTASGRDAKRKRQIGSACRKRSGSSSTWRKEAPNELAALVAA